MDNDEKKSAKKRIDKLFEDIQYEEPDTEPREKLLVDESSSQETGSVEGEPEADISETIQDDIDDVQPEMPETESDEPGAQETESTIGESEADISEAMLDDVDEIQPEVSENESEDESSLDDLLDDVRHSLIDNAAEKDEAEQSKWWKQIGIGSKRRKKDAESEQQQPEPVDFPGEPVVVPSMDVENNVNEKDEYVEQLDELIDMLEDESPEETFDTVPSTANVEEQPTSAPEPEPEVVDVKVLKERAFQPRSLSDEEEDSLSEVRSVALDDEGGEVFIEVEAKKEDTLQDRLKAIENALMPYRRYFTFVFVFVSLVMVLLVSASLYRIYQRSLPPPPTPDVALLPYPVGLNLPGGLNFRLGKGELLDGKWDPRQPEWLVGTEICRWIAIPYSRQLEAVVRTLTREDQLELVMSNNDVLKYTVTSIDQLSLEQMQQMDANSPCMLLVLAQPGTETRWVVTAIP